MACPAADFGSLTFITLIKFSRTTFHHDKNFSTSPDRTRPMTPMPAGDLARLRKNRMSPTCVLPKLSVLALCIAACLLPACSSGGGTPGEAPMVPIPPPSRRPPPPPPPRALALPAPPAPTTAPVAPRHQRP